MVTLVNPLRHSLLLCFIFVSLLSCSHSGTDTSPVDAQNEQSANPAVRLSGSYTCVRLRLDNGYTEGRGQLKGTGYVVKLQVKGDSVNFLLTGDGTAGRYNQLDLGTYAVDAGSGGSTGAGYFIIKKDVHSDYNAMTVIDRTVNGRQVTYSFSVTLYQFVAGTPGAGLHTPLKASGIFSATQRVTGIFTVERSFTLAN